MTDLTPPDDATLLATLGHDPEAFEAFYCRHIDRVTGFAVRRCRDADEVADLVAAVFLAVIESAERFDPSKGEPIGWLFGVAANQLRVQRRRRWRQHDLTVRISGQRLLEPEDQIRLEERIDAERLGERVRREVSRLPRGERTVFELVARDGLSTTQVSEALGISAVAVRVRLSRARAKLRLELGEAAGDGLLGGSPRTTSGNDPPGSPSRPRPRPVPPAPSAVLHQPATEEVVP